MKKKMKRFLSLGTVALAVTPIVGGMVSCGNSVDDTDKSNAAQYAYKKYSTFKNGVLTINKDVTNIDPHAFDTFYKENKDKLTTLTILGAVTEIKKDIFTTWSVLKTINLPSSLLKIDSMAFKDTINLTSLTIPDSVKTIENSAFAGSQLTSLKLSKSLVTIGASAFANSELTSLVIPNSVTTINNSAFWSSPLTSLTIPSGVGIINGNSFRSTVNQSSTTVTLPHQFNDVVNKGYIFGEGKFDKINFTDATDSIA